MVIKKNLLYSTRKINLTERMAFDFILWYFRTFWRVPTVHEMRFALNLMSKEQVRSLLIRLVKKRLIIMSASGHFVPVCKLKVCRKRWTRIELEIGKKEDIQQANEREEAIKKAKALLKKLGGTAPCSTARSETTVADVSSPPTPGTEGQSPNQNGITRCVNRTEP